MAADIKRVLFMLTYSAVVVTYSSAQHTVANVTLTELLFSSPGYIDCLNYAEDTTRDYRFQTFYPNHTLLLTVKEFVMENPDKNNDCLFDKVTIYDGYNDKSPVLRVLCGTIAAGTTYRTSGDTVYIVFYSDNRNTFKGFQMSVVTDDPTTTTSTTTTTTSTTHEPMSSMTSTTSTSTPTVSQAISASTVTNSTSSDTPTLTSIMHLSTKSVLTATSPLSLTKTQASSIPTLTRMSITHSSTSSVMPSVRTPVPKDFYWMRKIKSLMFRTRDFIFYESELSPVFNDKM